MAYAHEKGLHPRSHAQIHDDSIRAAKMFHTPPQYVHDLSLCYIMGFDAGRYDTLVTIQTREVPNLIPGTLESSLHHHASAYISGYESITEFVSHVKNINVLYNNQDNDEEQIDIPKNKQKQKQEDTTQLTLF